jgi:hypothetical protein
MTQIDRLYRTLTISGVVAGGLGLACAILTIDYWAFRFLTDDFTHGRFVSMLWTIGTPAIFGFILAGLAERKLNKLGEY